MISLPYKGVHMKKLFVVFLGTVLLSAGASAHAYDLRVSKTLIEGEAGAPNSLYIQCNIVVNDVAHGIEILRRAGNVVSEEFRPLRITNVEELDQIISRAKQGPIETHPGKPGFDSLSYVAIRKSPGMTEYVDLFSNGNLETVNRSPAASWLVRFVELHCPEFKI